ncbi:unnamed protein product [Ambrosiozyma monospora]|uniref:Unnamed protein product n=1 Tax=Ambrosiozyma monospora TaxID=43982 RepID=A0ACB5SY76_AMBMO|nr:unnamed protein product [Ambrosiozyma monospora]
MRSSVLILTLLSIFQQSLLVSADPMPIAMAIAEAQADAQPEALAEPDALPVPANEFGSNTTYSDQSNNALTTFYPTTSSVDHASSDDSESSGSTSIQSSDDNGFSTDSSSTESSSSSHSRDETTYSFSTSSSDEFTPSSSSEEQTSSSSRSTSSSFEEPSSSSSTSFSFSESSSDSFSSSEAFSSSESSFSSASSSSFASSESISSSSSSSSRSLSATSSSASPSITSFSRSSSAFSSSSSSSSSKSSSSSTSDYTSTVLPNDPAIGRLATFKVVYGDFYTDSTYYSSVNGGDYTAVESAISAYETMMFQDTQVQSSLVDNFLTYYEDLPQTRQDVLEPLITSVYNELYYSAADYMDGLQIASGSGSSSTVYDTAVTGTTGAYYSYYVLAECSAIFDDVNNYGAQYNTLYNSASNSQELSAFYTEYSSYTAENQPSLYNSKCFTSMASYVTDFPWSGRILQAAKSIYERDYVSGNPGYIYVGDATITPPSASYDINTAPQTVTGVATVTDYMPFVVSYEATTNTANPTATSPMVTSTLVTATGVVTTTGVIKNRSYNTATVSSDLTAMITCGVQALIYQYYCDTKAYDHFVSASASQTYVSNYKQLISNYSDVNVMKNTAAFQDVMVGFYNYVFELPAQTKASIADVMGYCYMKQATEGFDKFYFSDYTPGAGSVFSSLFKFGNGQQIVSWQTVTVANSGISSNGTVSATTTGANAVVTATNAVGVVEHVYTENAFWPVFPTSVTGDSNGVYAAGGSSNSSGDGAVNLSGGGKKGGFFDSLLS